MISVFCLQHDFIHSNEFMSKIMKSMNGMYFINIDVLTQTIATCALLVQYAKYINMHLRYFSSK